MKNPKLLYAGLSVTGRRDTNQDTFCTVRVNDRLFFAAAADGMGGYSGGEIASRLAIDTAVDFIETFQDEITSPESLPDFLLLLYEQVNHAFEKFIGAKPELATMGTTLTCLLVLDSNYVVGNIGDSRLYKFNSKADELITRDHTLLSQMQNTPTDGQQLANVLTKAMGRTPEDPDIFPGKGKTFRLNKGDAFLLCSDGLILNKAMHKKHSFGKLIQTNDSFETILNKLINQALEEGARDNITAVVIKTQQNGLNRKTKRVIIIALALVMIFAIATVSVIIFQEEASAFYRDNILPVLEWLNQKVIRLWQMVFTESE